MKKERRNFIKKYAIAQVCDDDMYRPAFAFVLFKDGNAVATNGHILVKASLNTITPFTDEEIALLNGCIIEGKVLDHITKTFSEVHVTENGIECSFETTKVIYALKKESECDAVKYPKYEAIFNEDKKGEAVETIGMCAAYLNRLSKAMGITGNESLKFSFRGERKAIFVTRNTAYSDGIEGVIMPVMTSW